MNANQSSYQFIKSPYNSRWIGLITKNGKIIANTNPSTEEIVIKFFNKYKERFDIDPQIKEESNHISQALKTYLDNPSKKWKQLSDLPISLEQFSHKQKQVYSALLEVPAGETISYGDLAERADLPRAARFVGSCMANNPLPLIIPCHRVIKADGSLGNYSGYGGVLYKENLLKEEHS